MALGSPVEVAARGVAPLGQQRVVVADAQHPLAFRGLVGPLAHALHQVVQLLDVADGRAVEVDEDGAESHPGEVAVGVDEARQQSPTFEVDESCTALLRPGAERGQAPHPGDASRLDGERLGDAVVGVQGEDGPAVVEGRYGAVRPPPQGELERAEQRKGSEDEEAGAEEGHPRRIGEASR